MKFAVRSSIYLLLLGLAIWWMGAHVVWLGDDLDYKYMMKGEIWQSWGKIKTVKDFFDSQLIHYQKVNGRFIAHSLVQIFNAKLGQQAFAVCNAIVYIICIFNCKSRQSKIHRKFKWYSFSHLYFSTVLHYQDDADMPDRLYMGYDRQHRVASDILQEEHSALDCHLRNAHSRNSGRQLAGIYFYWCLLWNRDLVDISFY